LIPIIGFLLLVVLFPFFQAGLKNLFESKSSLLGDYFIYVIPLTFFWIYISIYETYASLLQRIVVPKFIREIIIRILTILIIVLFFFNFINLNQFVFLFVSIYGIATVFNIIYINSIQKINLKPDWKFLSKPLRNELLKFILFMLVVGIGTNLSNKIDVFILGYKIGLAETGIFSIAFFIASFIEMPSRAIFQITTPFVSDALKNNDMQTVGSLYKRIAINQLIIGGLLFILIWINADNIFKIMPNGHIYESGKYVLLFIGIAKVFDAATGINATILGYSRYYYYYLFFIFFLAIISLGNQLIFIPLYGIVGSAIATAISIVLFNTIMVLFVKWKLKVQPFTLNNLKTLAVILAFLGLNALLPSMGNAYLDAAVRSVATIVLFVVVIYKINASKDINDFMLSVYNKYIKSRLGK
jgi:O-antigen/teichoic acid export membrane protein